MNDILIGATITFISMFVGWSLGRADRISEEKRAVNETGRLNPKGPIEPPSRPKPPDAGGRR